MNYLYSLFLFIPTHLLLAQSPTVFWEPEIPVSDGSVYGNIRPRIVVTADNVPMVVYGKAGGALNASRWNGTGFDAPVSLLPANMSSYLASWTGPDAASKGDTVVIVFKAQPIEAGNVYSVRSFDGGITFSDTIRVDDHDLGVAWLPSLDMDENGNPSVVYMAHDPVWVHPRYVVTHSTDQGATYQGEMDIALSIPDEACDCCPAEYVINGNQHALLYRNNESNIRDIYAVYSSDDGMTYPSFENIDHLSWAVTSCPSTGPHGIFSNDKLISVYASRAGGTYRTYVSETDATTGLSYVSTTMMTPPASGAGSQNYPRIAGQGDTLFVAWQEAETSNNEIMFAWTTTGSVSELLSSKQMVNTTTTSAQTNPDIAYKDGFIHLVYQDASSGDVIYRKGILGTLSVEDEAISTVQVSPNPSVNGKFYINANDYSSIEVIDIQGNAVPVNIIHHSSQTEIALGSNYGTFILKVSNEKGDQTIRIQNLK